MTRQHLRDSRVKKRGLLHSQIKAVSDPSIRLFSLDSEGDSFFLIHMAVIQPEIIHDYQFHVELDVHSSLDFDVLSTT